MSKIAVIGTTSWGITLALLSAKKKHKVALWARTEREAAKLRSKPEAFISARVEFPHNLTITSSIESAIKGANAVLLVVPSQSMRQNLKIIRDYLKPNMLIISAAKGLERDTDKRMTEVIAEETDPAQHSRICVLSGPNLAKEVLEGLPASAVIAATDESAAREAQELLSTQDFCIYTNSDVIGVELGGALKNIIALGAGMVDGLGYGDNAKAAFITRGLTEMAALGVALGANPLTLSGLAGLGDLIATCASTLSRNHYVGVELTKGRSLEEITNSMNGIAEGVATTSAVWNLAQKLNLGMPITEKIYEVLYEGKEPDVVMAEVFGTAGRHELVGRKWQLSSLFKHGRTAKPKAVPTEE
jgi:glycerol-3-phosphate dehydrogenase (NAD(P)+)